MLVPVEILWYFEDINFSGSEGSNSSPISLNGWLRIPHGRQVQTLKDWSSMMTFELIIHKGGIKSTAPVSDESLG